MTKTQADPAGPAAPGPPSGGSAPQERDRAPFRTCVGCRRRRPQPELVRLAVAGGQLQPGAGRPGRGAWLCRDQGPTCFDQAVTARRFGRALRSEVDPASFDPVRAWLVAQVTRDTTEGGKTGKVSPRPAR